MISRRRSVRAKFVIAPPRISLAQPCFASNLAGCYLIIGRIVPRESASFLNRRFWPLFGGQDRDGPTIFVQIEFGYGNRWDFLLFFFYNFVPEPKINRSSLIIGSIPVWLALFWNERRFVSRFVVVDSMGGIKQNRCLVFFANCSFQQQVARQKRRKVDGDKEEEEEFWRLCKFFTRLLSYD